MMSMACQQRGGGGGVGGEARGGGPARHKQVCCCKLMGAPGAAPWRRRANRMKGAGWVRSPQVTSADRALALAGSQALSARFPTCISANVLMLKCSTSVSQILVANPTISSRPVNTTVSMNQARVLTVVTATARLAAAYSAAAAAAAALLGSSVPNSACIA
jgi:hypothetical protein